MRKKLVTVFTIIFFGALIFSSVVPVIQAVGISDAFGEGTLGKFAGKAGYKPVTGSGEETVYTTIGMIINIALSLLGVIFLALLIYAGFEWMTARGDEAKVTKAKDIMKNAVIGLVIVLAAYVISYFVIYQLGSGLIKSSSTPQ
ncbi:MAG: pilin [Patescibacteria group bacterium]|jgi:hypothetical protein